jgi:lipopolysaccharide export system protein LptA
LIDFGGIPGRGRRAAAILAMTLAAAGVVVAYAQPDPHKTPSGPPNALQGFSQNRDKPVKITASELEVHDKDKMAVFSGGVHLVQGDTDMRSTTLIVYYDDQAPPPSPPPKSGKGGNASAQITPQQNQQIRKVEAKGNVIVKQKDQTATGDLGVFDMRANTVTMTGNVVITRGPNVLKGDILTVNMTSGDSAMTCNSKQQGGCGRVQMLIVPSSMKGQDGIPLPGRKP